MRVSRVNSHATYLVAHHVQHVYNSQICWSAARIKLILIGPRRGVRNMWCMLWRQHFSFHSNDLCRSHRHAVSACSECRKLVLLYMSSSILIDIACESPRRPCPLLSRCVRVKGFSDVSSTSLSPGVLSPVPIVLD